MTRDELEHAIRAACDVAEETEVYVFGSQSVLGEHPDAPEGLRISIEVDIAPKNFPERADRVDGSLGEFSAFHDAFGFYVHGLPIDAAILPQDWQRRLVRVQNPNTLGKVGWCLETHDLAASKLAAGRDKDRDFVRVLLSERLVSPRKLSKRIDVLPIAPSERERLNSWVSSTASELRE